MHKLYYIWMIMAEKEDLYETFETVFQYGDNCSDLIPEKGELVRSVKVRRSGGQAVGLMTWVSPGCKDSACSTHRKYALKMDRHKDKWKPAEASEHKRLPCMSQLICRGSPFLSMQEI